MNPEKKQEQIANRIRTARENAGLSQGQAAKLLGFQRPTISEIEAGRRRVTAVELARPWRNTTASASRGSRARTKTRQTPSAIASSSPLAR